MGFRVTWLIILLLIAAGGGCAMQMPGKSHTGPLPPLSPDQAQLREQLRSHVTELATNIGERNLFTYPALQQSARYIATTLRGFGFRVEEQRYRVDGKESVNLQVELRGTARPEEIVVVGAHYDSVLGSPGANDNDSGVAALLELARLFRDSPTPRTVRFVAFTNEEPPWFQTERMGSLVYARQARQRKEKIVGMLSLETIGCYSDRRQSQLYPAPLSLFYPDTGNFIAFVADFGSRSLLHRAIGTFRKTTPFPSEGLAAPRGLQGAGWSDHWAFWQEGYQALMVTDTALFRYQHYHEREDTPEKLDYDRMARVVAGMKRVVADLAEQ